MPKWLDKVSDKIGEKVSGVIPGKYRNKVLIRYIKSFVGIIGPQAIRAKMIDGLEKDFAERVSKNLAITEDELISEWVKEPEAMALLADLQMDETLLRFIAGEAIKGQVKCLD